METQILYGQRACRAVFERRSQDIRRIYYHRERAAGLGGMLAWAASRRIPYRELDDEGLQKVARSAHHEGLVLATEPLRFGALDDEALAGSAGSAGSAGEAGRWMAVDRVENPHNLGAILRTCAFLGVDALLAGGPQAGEKVNGAALRVAEGGAEAVRLYAAPEPAVPLAEMARWGFAVIGLESGGAPLRAVEFAGGPWVLVAGHEQEGLSPATRRVCTAVRGIEGTGAVSSLNVSVAVGIALAALTGASSHGSPDATIGARERPGRFRQEPASGARAARGEKPNVSSGKPRRRPKGGRKRTPRGADSRKKPGSEAKKRD